MALDAILRNARLAETHADAPSVRIAVAGGRKRMRPADFHPPAGRAAATLTWACG